MRARVTAEDDESVPVEAARLTVTLGDGTTLSEHVRHGRGTPGRPMSDAELDAKVRDLAAFGAPNLDIDRVIAGIRGIEKTPDAAALIGALRLAGE